MATVVSLDNFTGAIRSLVTLFRHVSVSRVGIPSMVINKYLADASLLHDGEIADAVALAKRRPELLLAALEVIEGSKLFGDEYLDQADFMALYSRQVPADVFIFAFRKDDALSSLDERGACVQFAKTKDSIIYFVQNVLRYAYHFGSVSRDPEAFSRFVSSYWPGIVVLNSEPTEYELMILNALAHFNIPIIQVGERWLPDEEFIFVDEDDLSPYLEEVFGKFGWHLLPERKSAEMASGPSLRKCGGTYNSFFIVRSMGCLDGVDVRGEEMNDLGIIIDIGDSDFDISMSAYIEDEILERLNHTGAVRVVRDEWFTIYLDPNHTTPSDLAETIYSIIKDTYNLNQVSVNVIGDQFRLSSLKPAILAYRENREKEMERQDELNSSFYLCTRCKSYSKNHFCIVTPERPPHCGRSYEMIKTLAHATDSEEYLPIKKGELLDRRRGEFAGVNKIARLMTGGKVERVFLHSFNDHPHPSSAELDILAFHIPRLDGIGLVHRGFRGSTPDGRNWQELERQAVGRRQPSVLATSLAYIKSRMFLSADGGPANILWMTYSILERLSWTDRRIATERDCLNLTSLKNFYE